ncbi:Eburicol 14-alpha-demethylase [Lachnellula suecica]|uniref:Eburicol 14-alpha-demethylase n=1 Tax=Lachnellula suecica TaxID=602035 RepID=A0A8T9CEG2_9HELO|nr:Eburicol 14-alpha-demethylase [Lachnellula suecica]
MGQETRLPPAMVFSSSVPVIAQMFLIPAAFLIIFVVRHVLLQLMFVNKFEPPVVFSWLPLFGSTIDYGMDPYKFYSKCQTKYGDIFTFVLIGKKHTVCLGPEGNNFVLNSSLAETSAADIYRALTVPIFGKDVCYDCSPAKFMEQKKFIKYNLTPDKLQRYIPLFFQETRDYVQKAICFQGNEGTFDVVENMSPLTLYTASATLQGKEVRQKLNGRLAELYHDLDKSFIPINFAFPGLPLPVNRQRDRAHKEIVSIYKSIIHARKTDSKSDKDATEDDMIGNLMQSAYKDGTPVADHEIAHTMIGLLMAGQHNTYSVASWILFRLATRPELQQELYEEQRSVFGFELNLEASVEDIERLSLHKMVARETLRLHEPIHSMLRAVKSPLTITTKLPKSSASITYRVPTTHVLMAAPGMSGRSEEYFTDPEEWEPRRWETSTESSDTTKPAPGLLKTPQGANSPYLPFGAGRHRCVGESFAYLQLCTMTAYFVHHFTFENPPGVEGIPLTDFSSMITRPVVPARLVWKRRVRN